MLLDLWEKFKASGDICFLNELILKLVSGHLNCEGGHENAIQVLGQLFQSVEHRVTLQNVILDVLWLFDIEAEVAAASASANVSFNGSTANTAANTAAVNATATTASTNTTNNTTTTAIDPLQSPIILLAKVLFENGFIDVPLALERLEPAFLEAIGIIASADLFNKKLIKLNTAIYYRQQKYNLLREESEGFSRLLIMLADESSKAVDPQMVFDRIMVMIGTFDLDPIRVLDLLLDEFTFHFQPELYIPLLKQFSFPPTTLISLLAFKLSFVASEEGSKFGVDYYEALFRMIASLLAEGLVSLPQLYPKLHPSDEECKQELTDLHAELIRAASRLGVVNLTTTATGGSTDKDAISKALEPDSLSEQFAADAFNRKLLELASARNQKVHLAIALLEMGRTGEAKIMLESLPRLLSLHPRLPVLVSRHPDLHHLLQPGHLAYNLPLFTQLCRSNPDKDTIIKSLLPALSLSGNDALLFSQELWQVLRTLPYQERFALYSTWSELDSPLFTFARASAVSEARKVLRRLAKETVRQYGRLVAKVTHSSPHVTLPLLLNQIQVYDNLIPSVVEAFRFLTPLSFDVLMWCLLVALASCEKDRLKEDGVNVADWLQNLARFASSLLRRHYASIDSAPLLRFIYAQLCDDNGLDVILLQEVLTLVAGIEKPENDSEAALEAHFGGPLLQATIAEASTQMINASSKPNRRAFARLKSALEAEGLTRPLLIALAQAVDAAVYRMDYEHLKFTASLVDVLQCTLQQYIRFLRAGDVEVDLSFGELVSRFRLTKASALFILGSLGKCSSSFTLESEPAEFRDFLRLFWSIDSIRVPATRYKAEAAKLTDPQAKERLLQELAQLSQSRAEQLSALTVQLCSSLCSVVSDRNLITETALNAALFPRLLQSPTSAILAADFLFLCHDCEVRNLSTLSLLDAVFDLPGRVLPFLTEFESSCFGRFMHECLGRLQQWQRSEQSYTATGQRLGFLKRWSEIVGGVRDAAVGIVVASPAVDSPTATVADTETAEMEEGELPTEPLKCELSAEPSKCELSAEPSKCELPTELEPGELSEELPEEDVASLPTEPSPSHSQSHPQSHPHPLTVSKHVLATSMLTWQDFRHVCYKWHEKITDALLTCFSSADFTAIRNAIIFSSRLQGTFPRLEKQSRRLEAAVSELKDKDTREDVKVLATRYVAMLTQNRPHLVKESQFHDVPDDAAVASEDAAAAMKDVSVRTERMKLKRSASDMEERSDPSEASSKRSRSDRDRKQQLGRGEERRAESNASFGDSRHAESNRHGESSRYGSSSGSATNFARYSRHADSSHSRRSESSYGSRNHSSHSHSHNQSNSQSHNQSNSNSHGENESRNQRSHRGDYSRDSRHRESSAHSSRHESSGSSRHSRY